MERITKELPNGTWEIDGMDWRAVPGNIYGALCKLRDYENTGLNPAEVNILKEKSNKLTLLNTGTLPKIKNDFAYCPNCNKLLGMAKHIKSNFFCEDCGQRITYDSKEENEDADKSE